MSQAKRFYDLVREQRMKLADTGKEYFFVTSQEAPQQNVTSGAVFEVSRDIAAELLVKGTHRLSTEEEVAASHKADEERRAEYTEIERKRIELLGFRPPLPTPPLKSKTKES